MSPEEFRRAGHQAVDWIADYLRDIRQYPILPKVEPGELTDHLPGSGPEQGEPVERILEDFRNLIVPATTHWNHPRFFSYFSISASGPGILGEMLAAAMNTNGILWKTSPALVELEQVTLGWLRQWLGLPDSFFGMIHDTASTSTVHAIAAARERVCPEARLEGRQPRLTLYTSEHAHSSVEKGALAIAVGQHNVRAIASDSKFRMRTDALVEAIERDLAAGARPFCVVATVGTTSVTSVDPVTEIAAIAQRYDLWLHVDAAYAGAAAILPEYRHILAGVEQADSLVLNPHKWLFTPIDISAFYCRRPEILRRTFSLKPPAYLKSEEHPRAVNLAEYGIPLGRRFRALKLWFVLRYYGREGIAAILRSQMGMARRLAAQIEAHQDFEIAAPVLFSLVCFRLRGSDEDNQRLLAGVNATGSAFLSSTVLNGRFVLRFAIGNLATTEEDIDQTWELVRRIAVEVKQEPAGAA